MGVGIYHGIAPKNDHFTLPLKAVHIQTLNSLKQPEKNATGFIVRQEGKLYLYTCWHVVSGYNFHDLKLPLQIPDRAFLNLTLQEATTNQLSRLISGKQTITLPLRAGNKRLWQQDPEDTPHPDLNEIGLYVPKRHDAVRICLEGLLDPDRIAEEQIIDEKYLSENFVCAGHKVLIVGYPYGFSTRGLEEPTPVVLTRFVAAMGTPNRKGEFLIDAPCAQGMSGAPVFIEAENELMAIGIYTGSIYPDYELNQNEKTTALGSFCLISISWERHRFSESP